MLDDPHRTAHVVSCFEYDFIGFDEFEDYIYEN